MLLRNKLNVRKKHSDSIGEKGGQGKGGKGRKTAKKKGNATISFGIIIFFTL